MSAAMISATGAPLLVEEDDSENDTSRIRAENGLLSLTIAAPLTNKNGEVVPNPGWMYTAVALLAVDHFNERNSVVVKELQNFTDCQIRLGNLTVIDTTTSGHEATKSMVQAIHDNGNLPDAIAGPFNDMPALELSVLATGMETPMVAFRGIDENLILAEKHPYFSQMNPSSSAEMEFLAEYLQHTNRTKYIAVLYSSEDSVLQRLEILKRILQKKMNLTSNELKSFGYEAESKAALQQQVPTTDDEGIYDNNTHTGQQDNQYDANYRGIREAVWKISQTGFRTIVMITGTPAEDTPYVGQAAYDYALTKGNHFWIIPGGLEVSATNKDKILFDFRGTPSGQFLRGAAFLILYEERYVNYPDSPFVDEIVQQNATFVQRLRDLNPVENYYSPYMFGAEFDAKTENFPPDDIFQSISYIADSSGFAYDAVMSIGIGACLAASNKNLLNSTAMTGRQLLTGIRSVHFGGETGQVRFQNHGATPGSRMADSFYYGVLNLLPYGDQGEEIVMATEHLNPVSHQWISAQQFVYQDGSHSPPNLLRSVPKQNYLNHGVRAFGLILMAVALLSVAGSASWVTYHRHHGVVIAAQPPFLYLLCLGSIITALTILLYSFDESFGWTDDMLDAACVAIPWLLVMGHTITHGSLFTKLWRLNKVLQFRRARIKVRQVVWPLLFLVLCATVILSLWTALGEFGWERTEIDELTGESLGRCKGDDACSWLIPVGVICTIPTILTGVMAWKTSDVDDAYSESKYIFALILVQLQVIIVAAPIVVVLQDVSTDGRFIGFSLIVWTFPMSTMGLIMVPKMLAVRREIMGIPTSNDGAKRGSRVRGVHVSGVPNSGAGNLSLNPSETATAVQEHTAPSSSLNNLYPIHNGIGLHQNGETQIPPNGVKSTPIQMVTFE